MVVELFECIVDDLHYHPPYYWLAKPVDEVRLAKHRLLWARVRSQEVPDDFSLESVCVRSIRGRVLLEDPDVGFIAFNQWVASVVLDKVWDKSLVHANRFLENPFLYDWFSEQDFMPFGGCSPIWAQQDDVFWVYHHCLSVVRWVIFEEAVPKLF